MRRGDPEQAQQPLIELVGRQTGAPRQVGDADRFIEMTAFEDFVTEEVRNGAPTVGLYPPTKEESLKNFEEWRKANGR